MPSIYPSMRANHIVAMVKGAAARFCRRNLGRQTAIETGVATRTTFGKGASLALHLVILMAADF